MSWFVDLKGKKVWVEAGENVFTVDEPPDEPELPVIELTYLSGETKQMHYHEHAIDEDTSEKGQKKKEKMAGRQRGFVVCVGQDKTLVTPCFQGAADKLIEQGVLSRIDVEKSGNSKKSKRKKKSDSKADEDDDQDDQPDANVKLGTNETRILTQARCSHFTHGPGFRICVASNSSQQLLNCFTAKKQLTHSQWHRALVSALEAVDERVMDGLLGAAEAAAATREAGRDKAQEDADDWLASVMGRCMVSGAGGAKASEAAAPAAEADDGTICGCGKDCAVGQGCRAERPKRPLRGLAAARAARLAAAKAAAEGAGADAQSPAAPAVAAGAPRRTGGYAAA
eukprot:TRINITY_DN23441_c0_g1_i1.p1 TRINITY_DN23441_c0_g1~~TRINITY_DN23441_c0_g1_i1.p1  ORF type:complete len:359 (-),score=71.89 TRINITY_DN23441_c0_g1_i1:102-1121(-)